MNLTETKPKAIISLLIVGLVILGLIILIFFSRNKTKRNQVSPIPTIPPDVQAVPQPAGFNNELAKINKFLPYKTNSYSIEYFKPGNLLRVIINADSKNDYLEAKSGAETYIKSKGVTDICNLNLFWSSNVPPEVKKTFQSQDVKTTGCPSFQK